MYATIRRYENNEALADRLAKRSDDIQALISGVPGFRAYYLVRSPDGTASITVCDDQTGAEEESDRCGLAAGEHARRRLASTGGHGRRGRRRLLRSAAQRSPLPPRNRYAAPAGMSQRDPHPFDDGSLWLTDAGAETALIFHQGVDLPAFATFPLLESESGRAALREYIEPFLDLARDGMRASCSEPPPGAPIPTGDRARLRRRGAGRRQSPSGRVRRGAARRHARLGSPRTDRGRPRSPRRRLRALLADDRGGGRAIPRFPAAGAR